MTTTRLRKVKTEREFEEVRDEYITMGYKVKEQGMKTCKLMKAEYGSIASHLLVFIVTFWSIFIGNVIWLIYNYMSNSDTVLLKLIDDNNPNNTNIPNTNPTY